MTIQFCLKICRNRGYSYAGLEYRKECFCGNEPERGFDWVWQTKCNYRCLGDQNQICGGREAISVWTVPSETLDGLCVHDFPKRVLAEESRTGSKEMTRQWCQNFCSGKVHTIQIELNKLKAKKNINSTFVNSLILSCVLT